MFEVSGSEKRAIPTSRERRNRKGGMRRAQAVPFIVAVGGGGVKEVLKQIRDKGFEPALWVAPFIAEKGSKLFKEHPDWFMQDAAGNHMIVEVPSGSCVASATPLRQQQMANARAAAMTCTNAVMVGVLFHDFFHHQTGVAPNVIELHPLLSFRCLVP